MKLTKTRIDKAKPGKHGDGRNLWLIVSPTGAKRWEFRYSFDGKPREMGIGPLDLVTLDEARDQAVLLRKLVREGVDPIEERKGNQAKRRKKQTTFREMAEDCIKALAPSWTNDKSEKQWRSSLEMHAFPKIGDMSVADISTDDVYAVLEPIWTTKSETAGRVRSRIEKVLDRAKARKLRTGENPARLKGNLDHLLAPLSKVKRVKNHAALPFDDVAMFLHDLRAREGVAARAFEFTILTAARTSETIGATWSEIDLQQRTWTIPAERMKARREHRIPLSARAVQILSELPREDGNDFVFISPKSKGKPLSNMSFLAVLRRMDRTDITAHGFRSTFRDWAAERTSYPDSVAEMALAHAISDAVEAAYRRGDLFEKRRRLMDDWAAYCEVIEPRAENVEPIRTAG